MTKPPPLLLGAALVFWGWRIDLLWAGALCGALAELPNAVKGRWDFSDKEFNRLWDVCTVIFIAVAAYLRFAEELTSGAYKFFQWMPLVFYLMTLGLVFSTRDLVPMKAFSWFLRRKGAARGERGIAFAWIYLVICLVAAGASNDRDAGYFLGITGIAGWSLWSIRPRRVPDRAWGALFAAIAGVAYAGQGRMQELQGFFESKASELLVHFGRREFDPNQSRTALGRIGELKQSGRIVLKVVPEAGPLPERLRIAALSRFEATTWRGWGRSFDPVAVEPDATSWTLVTNTHPLGSVRLIQRADRRGELLALPHGTTQLRELIAGEVKTNLLGAVRAEENPGLLNFVALKGIETFEESDQPDGMKTPFPNPLQNGVPRPGFPNGIDATNLIIQTNITPGPFAPEIVELGFTLGCGAEVARAGGLVSRARSAVQAKGTGPQFQVRAIVVVLAAADDNEVA